jgi:hypothetical protein
MKKKPKTKNEAQRRFEDNIHEPSRKKQMPTTIESILSPSTCNHTLLPTPAFSKETSIGTLRVIRSAVGMKRLVSNIFWERRVVCNCFET